jgi:glycosyltransferase involved in cell wall biosynthesis
LQERIPSVDIIVVDDGSSDETAAKALEMGVILVRLESNRGYSAAISEGFDKAIALGSYDYLVTVDADGQHDPLSVLAIIESAEEEDDIVIGQRSKPARFSEWLYSLYFRYKFGVRDPLCGLRLYKLTLFTQHGSFETFDSIGSELMTWALVSGKHYKTLDVIIRDRLDKPRFGSGIKVNWRIFKSLLLTIAFIKSS